MPTDPRPYAGPERRRRRVYVTQNREYHCRDEICIAVRDLQTGQFIDGHRAIGKTATAAVAMQGSLIASISSPATASPGVRMQFSEHPDDPDDVLTSELIAIARPLRAVVEQYERLR
ncbi:MAG TPA: hypothetical protein VGI39_05545 [Polyangiaceae bacterium]|jgi:hypothetical protein